jgi:hypothetical protein
LRFDGTLIDKFLQSSTAPLYSFRSTVAVSAATDRQLNASQLISMKVT